MARQGNEDLKTDLENLAEEEKDEDGINETELEKGDEDNKIFLSKLKV